MASARAHYRSVQRLIQVRPGNRDKVLDAAGYGVPFVVNRTQRGIAISFGVRDHANCKQIVNLLKAALLAFKLAMQRTKTFDSRLELCGNAVLHKPRANLRLDFLEELLVEGLLFADFLL